MIDQCNFVKRRECFLSLLEGKAAVIPAANMVFHHADCEYPFRQNSDFWYLTGFDEPDAVALFLPHREEGERFVLFVHPKDPSREVWNGIRCGTDGAVSQFGADIAHPLDQLAERLGDYLRGAPGIVFRVGKHPQVQPLLLQVWSDQLDGFQRSGFSALSLEAPCPLLHKLRLLKEPEEVERIRLAGNISAEAHELARKFVRPGMNERQLQGLIEQHFLDKGARGPAYGSIVAGGQNACVLHYTTNNSILLDGDLVLVDAGCSLFDYYNADITRTFPINGKFTPEQKAIYEIVLAAQEESIRSVVEGNNTEMVHEAALREIVNGLLDLGLLKGSLDSIIEQGAYQHFYMHRTGHWLGLDVHDVGAYRLGEYSVELRSGMVLTVEPGIYISDLLPVPKGQPSIDERWKGIGIRIEDDVLVSNKAPEVITSGALKSVKELENKI